MRCNNCKHELENSWLFCPFCGHKANTRHTVVSDQSGSYGSGVRAQIFELAVRQAMKSDTWRESCAAVMHVNKISIEEVETEVNKRLATASSYVTAKPVAAGAPVDARGI